LNDNELIQACLKHDKLSQKALYDKYRRQMYNICLRYCRTEPDAKEALQNGFIRVFNNLNRYRFDAPLEIWVRKIMVRTSIDQIKKNKKYYLRFDALETAEGSVYNDQMVDESDYDEILKAIEEMPEGYRLVFTLYVIDDMSHAEISEILQIAESTSRSQLTKARNYLKEIVKKKITNTYE